jgi:hypothetical protein
MMLEQDCCVHPTGTEKIIRRWEIQNNITGQMMVMEDCYCPMCGKRWSRLQGSGGEDV